MQRGEERGEPVRYALPLRSGEPIERGDVQLPAREKRVAGEGPVGGLVDVVRNADVDSRLEVAKQPGFVRERTPVRLSLGGPEDERLVEDQDRVVPAVRQVPVQRPGNVGELLLDSAQKLCRARCVGHLDSRIGT